MIVARLLRLTGHGEHDDASYVDPQLRASAVGGDCLKLARQQLITRRWAAAEEIEGWRAQIVAQIEQTIAMVQREPLPDPAQEDWCALSTRRLVDGGIPA